MSLILTGLLIVACRKRWASHRDDYQLCWRRTFFNFADDDVRFLLQS